MNASLEYYKLLLDRQLHSPIYNEREIDRLQKLVFEAQDLIDHDRDQSSKLKEKEAMGRMAHMYAKTLDQKRSNIQAARALQALNHRKAAIQGQIDALNERRKKQEHSEAVKTNQAFILRQMNERPPGDSRKEQFVEKQALYAQRTVAAQAHMEEYLKSGKKQALQEMRETLGQQIQAKQRTKERAMIEKAEERYRAEFIAQQDKQLEFRRKEAQSMTQQSLQEVYERQIQQKNNSMVYAGYPRYDAEVYRQRNLRRYSPFSKAATNIIS